MPSLSLDLERLIFEMAAFQDTDSRVRLTLVARRVNEWIRPILYRVAITQFTSSNIRRWKNIQITDVAPFVRHLLVICDAIELLSTFHNVENLAIWLGPHSNTKYFQKMNDLPLRKLSVVLTPIHLDEAIKCCLAFGTLTHLEIIATQGLAWSDCKAVAEFRKLTHFSLDAHVEDTFVRDFLEHCPQLRVMIYQPPVEFTIKIDDPRLLVFRDCMDVADFIREWERSANGQIGLWELADIIMEARKDKLFKNNSSFIFSRKTWMDGLNDDGRGRYTELLSGCSER